MLTSYTLDGVEVDLSGTTVEFTFTNNGLWSESITDDTGVSCEAGTTCEDDGTYIQTDVNLFICDPGCDEILDYTVSGDTLIISLTDPAEEEEIPFTATFVRTG